MGLVYASRATALKARVKKECQRRNYSGSVSAYGGKSYDYSVTPVAGGKLLQEHRDKIATPLNKINSSKVATASGLKSVSETDFATMEAFTTTLEKRTIYDNSGTDCNSGCTGMCYGCQTTCSGGCSGSCSGGCSGYCDGCSGCGGACSYSCSGDCDGCSGCGGACSYGCNSCGGCGGCGGCGNTCSGNCPMDCSGGCFGDCHGSCSGGSSR